MHSLNHVTLQPLPPRPKTDPNSRKRAPRLTWNTTPWSLMVMLLGAWSSLLPLTPPYGRTGWGLLRTTAAAACGGCCCCCCLRLPLLLLRDPMPAAPAPAAAAAPAAGVKLRGCAQLDLGLLPAAAAAADAVDCAPSTLTAAGPLGPPSVGQADCPPPVAAAAGAPFFFCCACALSAAPAAASCCCCSLCLRLVVPEPQDPCGLGPLLLPPAAAASTAAAAAGSAAPAGAGLELLGP